MNSAKSSSGSRSTLASLASGAPGRRLAGELELGLPKLFKELDVVIIGDVFLTICGGFMFRPVKDVLVRLWSFVELAVRGRIMSFVGVIPAATGD